jgi:hypothetical protein
VIGHIAAVALAQSATFGLSRLLRVRLSRGVLVVGVVLPHIVLLPWFLNDTLVMPGALIPVNFPGAPDVEADRSHLVLSDIVNELVPWEIEARRALAGGRAPLWSDAIDGGSSPWANPQVGVLSPIAMMSRLVPVQESLQTSVILRMLIALQGMWLLGRLVGGTRMASLIAGCGYALGGGIMAWAAFPFSSTLAWSPWLVAAFLRITRRPSPRFMIAGALCTAAIALSGHPESAFMSALLAAICGISLMRTGQGWVRRISAAGFAAVLGLGLAAPQVIPSLWAVNYSERSEHMKSERAPEKTPIWSDPLTWCDGQQILVALQPANPRALGTPYRDRPPPPQPWPIPSSLYSGLLVFAGAIAALGARRRAIIPFFSFAGVGLVLAVRFIPIDKLRLKIPVLEMIAVNRVLPLVSLCLCVAAVFGLSRIMSKGRWRGARMAVGFAAALSLLLARPPWVLALWIAILIATYLYRMRPKWILVILGVVLLADLVPWAKSMLPSGPRELFYPVTPLVTGLRELTSDGEPWRVVAQGGRPIASTLSVHGLEDVRYHNPLVPRSYATLLKEVFGYKQRAGKNRNNFQGVQHPLLDFLNVRAVVWVKSWRNPRPKGLRKIATLADRSVVLFKNPGALRRFFLPPDVTVVPSSKVVDAVAEMKDARKVILLAEEVGEWRPPTRPWAPRIVRVESLDRGHILIRVPPRKEKLLATSLLIPEGWRAVADGRALRAVTVNGAFFGAVIPDGVSLVKLEFRPPGLVLGVVIFLVSLVVFASLVAWSIWRHDAAGIR